MHAEAGTPAVGRAITATVTSRSHHPAGELCASRPASGWSSTQHWRAKRSTELPHSELIVGPNTYTPTDRFFVETLKAEISPGIAQRGSWVFDVAPALLEPGASEPLTLRVWVGDAFLDSRLVIRIPTDDSRVSHGDTVDLVQPVQSAS